jgi:single-strand DNA-binding protein
MIHATILGRLGRDPEIKNVNGTSILNFSMATDHGFGDKKQTMWIRCSVFGKRADTLAQYLAKGSQVLVQGELYTREWEKKDGTTATELEFRVAELEFAGSKGDSQQQPAQQQAPAPAPRAQGGFDDSDVPFAAYMRGSVA